jgi:ribonuclease R
MSKKAASQEPLSKPRKKDLTVLITDFLTENKDKQFNYKQIAAALNVKGEDGRRVLIKVLDKLRDDDIILESSRGRYRIYCS